MELTQEQLGNLVKYAVEKSGIERVKFIRRLGYYPEDCFDDEEAAAKKGYLTDRVFELLEDGTWEGKAEYIACFSLALRRIVPRKIKLKRIPASLPSREKIEELMQGLCDDLVAYKTLYSHYAGCLICPQILTTAHLLAMYCMMYCRPLCRGDRASILTFCLFCLRNHQCRRN